MAAYVTRGGFTGGLTSLIHLIVIQVRKLEFVLADALVKKCNTVLTCGGIPSNHCRTTAVAARQLGLKCYLFLRSSEQARQLFSGL